MPDPQPPPQPKQESYTHCALCSQANGEPVYYHRSQLKLREQSWWDGTKEHWECPFGHTVEPPAPKPAPASS